MGKGKGRRRRQANYLAAHGGTAPLPRPPDASDVAAVPSKLRRIITLKSSSPQDIASVGSSKQNGTRKSHNKSVNKNVKHHKKQELKNQADESKQGRISLKEGDGGDVCLREISRSNHKKRKWEDELQVLSERFKATPIRKGLNDRKKSYLQEKKRKKKRLMHVTTMEQVPSIHQQERISFGEIVEAPPKLSFCKKQKNAAEERFRQQAIATYREKKKWNSRPGSHQPPPLTNMRELVN